MRISDWSSDVCSSDLVTVWIGPGAAQLGLAYGLFLPLDHPLTEGLHGRLVVGVQSQRPAAEQHLKQQHFIASRRRRPIGQFLTLAIGELAPVAHFAGEPFGTLASSEERRVGKSVSGRVDLGGRRIIKKKKKQCNRETTRYHKRTTIREQRTTR